MSKQADRDIDIRAFLQQDRERILRAIRKRIEPHIVLSGYFRSNGEQTRMWIDRMSNHPKSMARSTELGGFVVKTIIGVEPDGIVISEDRGSLKTKRFSDLPYEDLMKVSNWVARRLLAPPIERDAGMARIRWRGPRAMKNYPFPYEPGQCGWLTPNDQPGAHMPVECTLLAAEGDQLIISSPAFTGPTKVPETRFYFSFSNAQRAVYVQSVMNNPALFAEHEKFAAEFVQLWTEDRDDARVDLDYAWSRAACR